MHRPVCILVLNWQIDFVNFNDFNTYILLAIRATQTKFSIRFKDICV